MHVSHTSSHSHVFLLLICHVLKTVHALAELDVLTPSLKEELTDWICKAIPGWTLFCCCKAHFYFLLIEEDWGGCWTVFTFLSDLRGCSICTIWKGRESFLKSLFYSLTSRWNQGAVMTCSAQWGQKFLGYLFRHEDPTTTVPMLEWKQRDRWKQQRGWLPWSPPVFSVTHPEENLIKSTYQERGKNTWKERWRDGKMERGGDGGVAVMTDPSPMVSSLTFRIAREHWTSGDKMKQRCHTHIHRKNTNNADKNRAYTATK